MTGGRQGYSLIELSIVLLVVALITGGIFTASTMIHNGELASIINAVNQYEQAAQLFKQRYSYLPGDMPNATGFWGTDAGCPSTPANIVPKTATCNGDGNGFIGDSTGTPLGTVTNWYEPYRAWQHLNDAGFLNVSFSGALSSRTAGNNADPGMNIPASKITSNGFTLLYAAPTSANTTYYASNYGHVIVYGQPAGKYASAYNPGLSAIDAASIDGKIDDGLPGTGSVLSFTPNLAATSNCASTAVPSTAAYNAKQTGILCSLIFVTGF